MSGLSIPTGAGRPHHAAPVLGEELAEELAEGLADDEASVVRAISRSAARGQRDVRWPLSIAAVLGVLVFLAVPGAQGVSHGDARTAVLILVTTFVMVVAVIGAYAFSVEHSEGLETVRLAAQVAREVPPAPHPSSSGKAADLPGAGSVPEWLGFFQDRLDTWGRSLQAIATFGGLGVVTTLFQSVAPAPSSAPTLGPVVVLSGGSVAGGLLSFALVALSTYIIARFIRQRRRVQLLMVFTLGKVLRTDRGIAAAYLAATAT